MILRLWDRMSLAPSDSGYDIAILMIPDRMLAISVIVIWIPLICCDVWV